MGGKKRVQQPHPKMVLVEWQDAHADDGGWLDQNDIDPDKPATVYSVGFQVGKNGKHLVLAQDYSDGMTEGRGKIVRENIVRVTEL